MNEHLLLDSTVLIDALRRRSRRRDEMSQLARKGYVLCVAAVNVAEVYAGMRRSEEAITQDLFEGLLFYPMTEAIARRAGLLQNVFARKSRTLGLPDMMAAATALEYDFMFMTDNIKDFPIPELKLYQIEAPPIG